MRNIFIVSHQVSLVKYFFLRLSTFCDPPSRTAYLGYHISAPLSSTNFHCLTTFFAFAFPIGHPDSLIRILHRAEFVNREFTFFLLFLTAALYYIILCLTYQPLNLMKLL